MEWTIMCHDCTPEQVRDYIESRPGTEIQWRGEDWRVSYGFGPDVFLDIMFLAGFNSEPQWSQHLNQLRKFVRANVDTDQDIQVILDLLDQQKFGLSVLAEPDIADWSDDRLAAIKEYANHFGTFVCSEDGLFDAELQPLVCENGGNRTFINSHEKERPWWKIW